MVFPEQSRCDGSIAYYIALDGAREGHGRRIPAPPLDVACSGLGESVPRAAEGARMPLPARAAHYEPSPLVSGTGRSEVEPTGGPRRRAHHSIWTTCSLGTRSHSVPRRRISYQHEPVSCRPLPIETRALTRHSTALHARPRLDTPTTRMAHARPRRATTAPPHPNNSGPEPWARRRHRRHGCPPSRRHGAGKAWGVRDSEARAQTRRRTHGHTPAETEMRWVPLPLAEGASCAAPGSGPI